MDAASILGLDREPLGDVLVALREDKKTGTLIVRVDHTDHALAFSGGRVVAVRGPGPGVPPAEQLEALLAADAVARRRRNEPAETRFVDAAIAVSMDVAPVDPVEIVAKARGCSPEELRRPTGSRSALGAVGPYLFALALAPLVVSILDPDDVKQRLLSTLSEHPDVAQAVDRENATMQDLLGALPSGRLDGALLPYGTSAHWGIAAAAALLFFGAIVLLFDRGRARARQLALVGVFTGTAGILLLLGVQWIAEMTQGVWLRGGGIVALLFYVVKAIGFSYRAALDPENGFLLSFVGFTCGVGLCEEVVKALPVLVAVTRRVTLDARALAAWGLASGVGFGVAEGIMYAGDYYNGVHRGLVYAVRFVSCVALHAVWSAAVALAVYERRADFALRREHFLEHAKPILRAVAVPMVLHGLYDTLLKKDLSIAAVLVAVLSFGWLIFRLERLRLGEARLVAA